MDRAEARRLYIKLVEICDPSFSAAAAVDAARAAGSASSASSASSVQGLAQRVTEGPGPSVKSSAVAGPTTAGPAETAKPAEPAKLGEERARAAADAVAAIPVVTNLPPLSFPVRLVSPRASR